MNFGARLKQLRIDHEETQLQISQLLGTAKSNISKYESNSVEPSIAMLTTLAKHFNVSVDYLLCISDKPIPDTNEPNNWKFFPERLQNVFDQTNLSYDSVSEFTNISENDFKMYLNGTKQPSIYDLCKLIEIFETTADYLFGITDIIHPKYEGKNYLSDLDSFSYIFANEAAYNGLFNVDLSNQLNISIAKIEKLLTGQEMPEPNIVYKLAQLFEKSTDYLLGLSKNIRSPSTCGEFPFKMEPLAINRIQMLLESDSDDYLAKELGLTEDEFFYFYHYGFVPHITVLNKVCQRFHVSADYLLGISDSKLTIISAKGNDEDSLIQSYRKLDEQYRKKIDGFISEQILQQERDQYMRLSVAADNSLKDTGTYGPKK